MKEITVAAIQMQSGEDKKKNLARAEALIFEAAQNGAEFIALPEMFNWRGSVREILLNAESIPGDTTRWLSRIASSLKVYLVGGSITEKSTGVQKAFNTSLLFNKQGKIIARYRKIHLFQYRLKSGQIIREDNFFLPGGKVVTKRLAFGNVGLSICYDLRFPEVYREMALKRCPVIVIPSAFTFETGKLHWKTLLKARAIENQAYVIAPNQSGSNPPGGKNYGHSMIVGPSGEILGVASKKNEAIMAQLNFRYLHRIRRDFPVLSHFLQTCRQLQNTIG